MEGETILVGLFRAGFAYRVGCRRGGCGVCKVDLLDGGVAYDHVVAETVLTEQERGADACLSCRAVPVDDLTIALRDDTLQVRSPLLRYTNAPVPVQARQPSTISLKEL